MARSAARESVGRVQRHAGTRLAMRCGPPTHTDTAGGPAGAWHMRRSGSLRCTVAAVVVRGPVVLTPCHGHESSNATLPGDQDLSSAPSASL
jgi:hypothetical protein